MSSIHMILQGEGGVGKSLIAVLIAQCNKTSSGFTSSNSRRKPAAGFIREAKGRGAQPHTLGKI